MFDPIPEAEEGSRTRLGAGLRRALWIVIGSATLMSGGVIFSTGTLKNQIDRWSLVEEIDTSREQLLVAVDTYLDDVALVAKDEIVAGFRDLEALIAKLGSVDETNPFSMEAGALVNRAHGLLLSADQHREAIDRESIEFRTALDRLRKVTASWVEELRRLEQSVEEQAIAFTDRQIEINGKLAGLISAMLEAQRVQRQILAAERIPDTTKGYVADAARSALENHQLPKPCANGEIETAGKICSPSSSRLLVSLDRLTKAGPGQRDGAVQATMWAIEGYMRAGQNRYQSLSADYNALIEEARQQRSELTESRRFRASLDRTMGVLVQLQNLFIDARNGGPELEQAGLAIPSTISRLKHQMGTLHTRFGNADAGRLEVLGLIDTTDEIWGRAAANMAECQRLLVEFERQMAALTDAVSTTAADVRLGTTLRVSLFATIALAVAATFAGSVIALVLLAQHRFVSPLVHVTDTIDRLVQGQFDEPVVVMERAFGFDRLGTSLEKLRRAVVERVALARHNEEQKLIIETNMRDLETFTQELQWLAMHDPLTQLQNRRSADEYLADLTATSRGSGRDFALVHIDVDRFKEVNDTLGHEAGDFVLKHVAQIIMDLAIPHGRCFRIGGDEFLIGHDCSNLDQVCAKLCQRLISEIARPIEYKGRQCSLSASIGVAFGRDVDFDAAATLINADLALYTTKRAGRNGHRFFSHDLQEIARQRKEMQDLLLQAIEDEIFEPFYQPQFHSSGLELRGVETLCRWHDEKRGWISPGEFLPIAEELKLVGEIDNILCRKAARHVERIRSLGLHLPKISFNITADRLTQANLAQEICGAFTGDTRIAIELLESMSLDNPGETISSAINSLKDVGIAIEIDDFGSCRASVAGLIAVGPDAMKIDRSIIMPITHSSQHLRLVRAMIEIGRALEIEIVGEGVETDAHVEILTELGCDVLQGYNLARPMPIDDLIELLKMDSARPPSTRPASRPKSVGRLELSDAFS